MMIAEARQLLEEVDNLSTKEKVKATLENIGKGARTKARKQAVNDYAYIDEERYHRFKRLLAIVEHHSKSFAESSAFDDAFILSLTNACYRAVEDGGHNRQKDLKDVVFKIIGICVKRFSHGFQCALRCSEIMQRYEYGPAFSAELINLLCTTYSNATVLRDVIADILKAKPEDLALDSSNVKNICAFLVELAEKYPSMIISPINCFEIVSVLLERDPYSMRSAVLSMAAAVVKHSKTLKPEKKDAELVAECIDCLKAHTMDVNAFVRGKALQLLQGLIRELCLPVEEQLNVLAATSARLCDKSSIVRRYAIQTLGTLVEVNQLALRLAIQSDGSGIKLEKNENGELAAGLAEFAQFSATFSDIVKTKVLNIISDLIESKATTDLLESIEFLVLSSEYGLASLSEPILLRSLDNLVSAEVEQPIKTDILQAFDRLYVEGRPANTVIENFVRLLSLLETFSSLDGFGEMLTGIYKDGKFPTSFYTELVRQFSSTHGDLVRRRQLGLIICLLSPVKPPQLIKVVDSLIAVALETSDLLIAKFIVDALGRLLASERKMKANHKAFMLFSKVITDSFATTPVDVDWFSLFRSSLVAIYELCDNPEKIVIKIIREMHSNMMACHNGGLAEADVASTRFFYAVGEIAMRQYMFLEGPVLKHMKYSAAKSKSRELEEKKKQQQKDGSELEMALGCATAPDLETDAVISLLNNLVTDPSYLLTNFVPVISQDATGDSPSFATLLCLVKFMLVSQPVAQVLMPVFEKALDKFLTSKETSDVSKNSLLVGLADLFIRFPTITGKISQVLFSCLHSNTAFNEGDNDMSTSVSELRQTALIIVSYLAMNDMLRIRDHLADIAVVTLDYDPTIRTLSKELITEIATKNNALYNAMANILTKLAAPVSDGGLLEEDKDFEDIVSFLFKLVTKDKQTDQLLARILSQIKTVSDVRFARRLATCVLYLPLADRSLSIFHSNFSQFADYLTDDTVYGTLSQALTKLKPTTAAAQTKNPELRDQIDELLAKFSAAHDPDAAVQISENGGVENAEPSDGAFAGSASKKPPPLTKFTTPGPSGRGRGTRSNRQSTVKSPLGSRNSSAEGARKPAPSKSKSSATKAEPIAPAAKRGGKKKVVVNSDSDE